MSISRTDPYGLLVRVKRNGKLHSRYFSFQKNGGKRATMIAARLHQSKLEQIPRKIPVEATSRNRTTRLRGISLSAYRNRVKGTKVFEYKVNFTAPKTGRRKVKTFYVGTAETFTKARAKEVLREAVRFRARWLREQRRAARR